MAGTKEGGQAAAKKNIELYGPDFYKRIGTMGGSKKFPKGFAMMSKERLREIGRKGGISSKRSRNV